MQADRQLFERLGLRPMMPRREACRAANLSD
jgi:hypothetical protein